MPFEPRAIRGDEAEVIRTALARPPLMEVLPQVLERLAGATVNGVCGCGCASIHLELGTADCKPIADAVGTTVRGHRVGVLVWGRRDTIVSLEIYDLEDDTDVSLPTPASIQPFASKAGE